MTLDFFNDKGQVVGTLIGKEYHTDRRPEHFMRIYQGFGISSHILQELKTMGCTKVRLFYYGVHGVKKYSCPLSLWMESEKKFTFGDEDEQLFVSIRDMESLSSNQQTL